METKTGFIKNVSKFVKDLPNGKKKMHNQNQHYTEEKGDSMGKLLLVLILIFICYSIYLAYH